MRPLSEWDSAYLDELVHHDETASFEKKAAEGLTREKIAQGVCAFANSGEGFLAFGFKDEKAGGGLDAGVHATKGRQPVKDWAEALIPTLHQPPIGGCEAKFIQHPTHHQPGCGVLVIAVPQSERRPHWTRDEEKAYLRVGSHSAPMRPQTLLDMRSRGSSPRGVISELGFLPRPSRNTSQGYEGFRTFLVTPKVFLESGPVCELWVFELRTQSGRAAFSASIKMPKPGGEFAYLTLGGVVPNVSVPEPTVFAVQSREPLFPKRLTDALPSGAGVMLTIPRDIQKIEFVATLYLAAAPPVVTKLAYILEGDNLVLLS